MDELLSEFMTESAESLDQVDTELVHLEQHPDDRAALNTIFRLVHTIKGTCGFFGLSRLERVAHAAETALDRFRETDDPIPADVFPVVLEAIDRIKIILAAFEGDDDAAPDADDDLVRRLELIASGDFSDLKSSPLAPEPVAPQALNEADGASGEPASPDPFELHQAETVRVNLSVLDELMGMVSELVISRNQLLRMVRDQDDSPFIAPLKNLSQVVTSLQDGITLARVQPIQTAWAKLPRIVRDLAHELDKIIVLEMVGGEAELDRQVIEAIKDPLVHMIRNAADHGLETPDERADAGKPETGTIRLKAWPESGHVIVEMTDDGRGIDLAALASKAIDAGIVTPEQVADMSETQTANLVFLPGLSTSEEVTSVSGRGVGMDVVRSNIERIGGQVEIQETGRQGSVFRLRLPLTLSIIPALIVEADGQQFAIPQSAISELVRAGAGTPYPIDQVNGADLLRLRELTLALVSLNTSLDLSPPAPAERRLAVVIRHGTANIALSVDRVLDTEEIVVKPLTPLLASLRNYSGTTILGDGRVVMILDPGGLTQGVIGEQQPAGLETQIPLEQEETNDVVSLVLFKSGPGMTRAVPLQEIERLAQIDGDLFEQTSEGWVMRYRERIIPIVSLDDKPLAPNGRQALILFRFGSHQVGLAVDEILEIEECRPEIELTSQSDLVRGIANIVHGPVEIVDLSALAWQVADRLPELGDEAAA